MPNRDVFLVIGNFIDLGVGVALALVFFFFVGFFFARRLIRQPEVKKIGADLLMLLLVIFLISVAFFLLLFLAITQPAIAAVTSLVLYVLYYNYYLAHPLNYSNSKYLLLQGIIPIIPSMRKYDNQTIVGQMFYKKAQKNELRFLALAICPMAYLVIVALFDTTFKLELIVIPFALFLLLLIQTGIIEYRILNGYFGTNKHEAKELLKFILSEADSSSFVDKDGKPKEIFNPEALGLEPEFSLWRAKA